LRRNKMPEMMEGSEFWYLTNSGQRRLEQLDMAGVENNIDFKILDYMRSGESVSVEELADYLGLRSVIVVGMLRTMHDHPHTWVMKETKYDEISRELEPYWDEETKPINPRVVEGMVRLGGERRSDLDIPGQVWTKPYFPEQEN